MKLLPLLSLLLLISSCAHAQVMVTYEGDTLNGKIKKMTEYEDSRETPLKKVYTYDAAARVRTANFHYNEKGQEAWFGKWVVTYDSAGHLLEDGLYCSHDKPCEASTYRYDAYGRVVEYRSFSDMRSDAIGPGCGCGRLKDQLSGEISNWAMGVFSSASWYRYDNLGRLVEIKNGHSIGDHMDSTGGTARYRYTGNSARLVQKIQEYVRSNTEATDSVVIVTDYDQDSSVVQIKKETVHVSEIYTNKTTELTNYKYDSRRNKVEEKIVKYDQSSTYVDSSRTVYRYDARNNRIELTEYFSMADDQDGKPKPVNEVGAGSEYTYDTLDNMTSVKDYKVYRQLDGQEEKNVYETKKIPVPEKELKEYDEYGNHIRTSFKGSVYFRREIEYY